MDASPTVRIKAVLTQLNALATVYIISGRPGDVLDSWFGDIGVGMVCEHGYAMKVAGGKWEPRRAVGSVSGLNRLLPLFKDFVSRTPGSTIEHKRSAIAWHYRAADPEWGTFQANELYSLLEDALRRRPYNVLRGSRVIEVRHENATKGHATSELLKRHGDADVVFCAGDDRTDEEMMEAIPRSWRSRAITCWVGGRNSIADFWVDSAEELLNELDRLAHMWRGSVRPPRQEPTHKKAARRRRRA
jgi:trehalose 6-phosphate synthase/phosphatase